MDLLHGFSKLSPDSKIELLASALNFDLDSLDILKASRPTNQLHWERLTQFTENVVAAYNLPFSIAPNFLINNKLYHVPMVIEESSVVAAASWSAKFWAAHGGFQTKIIAEEKIGQIHFTWSGSYDQIKTIKELLVTEMRRSVASLSQNMVQRGGGIVDFEWLDYRHEIPELYQCRISFHTADSMGANFINSCLEQMSQTLKQFLQDQYPEESAPEIIMAILSNYTPNCRVCCSVGCDTASFSAIKGVTDPKLFAERFLLASQIAAIDPYRAVTHNKGIFNGMDAVVLATANDFRAFEAGGHAYASRNGTYTSLTSASLDGHDFQYNLEVSMALGVVGGLTSTHPLAALSLAILGNPSATELMSIVAAAGLANNFSALKALTTTGIQEGHMRMHLSKMLIKLGANPDEIVQIQQKFSNQTISYQAVSSYLDELRGT